MAFDYPTIIGTCHNMVYVYINIYIYDGDPEIGQYHSPFPWRYHIPLLPSPLHPEQS